MEIHGTAVILNESLLLLVNLLKVPIHSAFVSLLISRDVVVTIMIIVIRAKLLTREGETLGGGGVAGRSMQTSYKRTLIIKISLPWRSSNRS